jgi:hypothetical protein
MSRDDATLVVVYRSEAVVEVVGLEVKQYVIGAKGTAGQS